ncbi:NADH-quinone oxidoreductase subunit C, partial [Porticoccaceae bacterium]|nr:NADH-quinone oxidoreductase subunit C [Porticoccaceae bacterium]
MPGLPLPHLLGTAMVVTNIRDRIDNRSGQPVSDFTVVYQLLSLDRNEDIRIKVALAESSLNIPTIISL